MAVDQAHAAAPEEVPVVAEVKAAEEPRAVESTPVKKGPTRCASCCKKVGLTGFICRCGSTVSPRIVPRTAQCPPCRVRDVWHARQETRTLACCALRPLFFQGRRSSDKLCPLCPVLWGAPLLG